MSTDGDIGRIEGKLDMLITAVEGISTTQTAMLKTGCALGAANSRAIDRHDREFKSIKQEIRSSPKNDGSWIGFGKLRAAGLPAVILAIFIGWAIFQHYQLTTVADDVKRAKIDQDSRVANQAQALAKIMVSEIVKELKP